MLKKDKNERKTRENVLKSKREKVKFSHLSFIFLSLWHCSYIN